MHFAAISAMQNLCHVILHNKRVSQSCAERTGATLKRGLSNMADGMEEVNVGAKKKRRKWRCTALYFVRHFSTILEVLWDFHRLFGSRNSPTTGVVG